MTILCETNPELIDFSGLAPIFPLPNVVLFPQALLPLHIFEPRYRKMTADALEGERLIAMGLLRPGWKSSTVPPVHRIMGLGKIIAHEKLADGRFNLILRGLARVKLLSEKQVDLPYRIGQFEICREYLQEQPLSSRQQCVEKILHLFGQLFPKVPVHQLFVSASADLPLQTVCDVLLGSIPMPQSQSQQFLDELDVDARGRMLVEYLEQSVGQLRTPLDRKFPPEFSSN